MLWSIRKSHGLWSQTDLDSTLPLPHVTCGLYSKYLAFELFINWKYSFEGWLCATDNVLSESESVKSLSHVWLSMTPWTVAHQAPLSMEFSRQEYWSRLPFPSPGIFLTQGWPRDQTRGRLHCGQILYHPATREALDNVLACVRAKSLQPCLTLCDPADCSLPGSSVREILQARVLDWVAISSSRGSSLPMDWTCISYVSYNGWQVLYQQVTREAPIMCLALHYMLVKICLPSVANLMNKSINM